MILAARAVRHSRMTLSGEMSRWSTPSWCAARSPDASRRSSISSCSGDGFSVASTSHERRAVDVIGDDVEDAALRLLREHAIFDQRLVMQPGHRPRFPPEHRDDLRVGGERRQHDLDRHPLVGVTFTPSKTSPMPPRAMKRFTSKIWFRQSPTLMVV